MTSCVAGSPRPACRAGSRTRWQRPRTRRSSSAAWPQVAKGVQLFEMAPVLSIDVGQQVTLTTPAGPVHAERVVLARNAWGAADDPFRRRVLPFYVYDVITEPLPDDQWAELGWDGREPVNDRRFFLINYRRTPDGRVMFGGVDGRQPFGGRISPRLDRVGDIFAAQTEVLTRVFPSLADVRITFGHGGPIAMTPSLFPQVGLLEGGTLGLQPRLLRARVAGSACLHRHPGRPASRREHERSHYPFVAASDRRYPVEPLVGSAAGSRGRRACGTTPPATRDSRRGRSPGSSRRSGGC